MTPQPAFSLELEVIIGVDQSDQAGRSELSSTLLEHVHCPRQMYLPTVA